MSRPGAERRGAFIHVNEASSSGGNSAKGDDDEGDNDEDDDDDDDDDDIVARASRIVDARRRSHDDGSAAPGNNDDDNIHDIGNGDDGIEDEEDEFEESERLWRRARLKLGPDEDREHYLCDEAGVLAALKHGRKGYGCDLSAEYIAVARERIQSWQAGTLKPRPLEKPIYDPSLPRGGH